MRVALVYDRVVKYGGAERILMALHAIWPDAPLYTGVYDPVKATWSSVFQVHCSFLCRWPFSFLPHELLAGLTPLAFSSFSLDAYDVVISVTSSDAKGIITKPHTLHICYCLTPTRYLWSGYHEYVSMPGFGICNKPISWGFQIIAPILRTWDLISSSRPDRYVSISQTVSSRIKTYYHTESAVIYPPICHREGKKERRKRKEYYLVVSRLVPYKQIDHAVIACTRLGRSLKIIGKGIDLQRLKHLSGPTIEYITDYLTEEELNCYYQECNALIFPGEEDFGLVMAEAQSWECPVIAYGYGGSTEIITPGKTGQFYYKKDPSALQDAIMYHEKQTYVREDFLQRRDMFSERRFLTSMKSQVTDLWEAWRKEQI